VDLGLCETCCNDSPCGPAGGFAEYAVALADTVAKRDGLSSKDLVGLPLAGTWKSGNETKNMSLLPGQTLPFLECPFLGISEVEVSPSNLE